ncbi:hypothetical protein DACRYDRAFT_25098 [Dacryopinax primogenitus]|uniref:Uncharacterized protein n=1 Tax=Dacryopinax primogenitus (strain DJM 731) TaxID=1858805 RepID=M5FR18_DACPD|nr:uncharacterized protein DACRYDRAFT_25098 [Dacryopinax primogenitus]EJT97284.1 hypothetical protein DACRYDRAFT_25098 [Dacryopinax primogenitus]
MVRFPRLQYPVTRDYSLAFTIFTFLGFGLIGGLLAAINFAADGYQTLTVISSDFNSTQTFWYDKVVPSFLLPSSATNRQCQPYTYHVGDKFRTTNKIFNWVISNVLVETDGAGNSMPGTIHSAMPYSNVPLDYCDVMDIHINADLFLRRVTASVDILCEMPIPLVANTLISSSEVDTRASVNEVPWLTTYGSTFDYTPQLNVSMATNVLGWDLLIGMQAEYAGSLGNAPTLLETKFDFRSYTDGYCPAIFVGTGKWCSEADNSALPIFTVDAGDYVGFDNFTVTVEPAGWDLSDYTISNPVYWNPIRNFIHATHAAARADLGAFRPSNMFQNLSMMPLAVNTTGYLAAEGKFVQVPLYAAELVLTGLGENGTFSGLPMPPANGTLIDTSYVCNRQFLKNPAALFFAITSGTLSNILVLWGFWMLLASRHVKAGNPPMNTCTYHALEQTPVKRFTIGSLPRSDPKDWTYARASTASDEPGSTLKSPWDELELGVHVGHQYPPPPSWMLQLPGVNRNQGSYESVLMEDLSPPGGKSWSTKSA